MKALISVSDKEGIVSFAQGLAGLGFEIISTGGTFKVLKDNGVAVTAIDDVTQFPEMLDGRVKTLHPKIHGGLLALRDNETHMSTCKDHGIGLIDLVVVNLYPFEKTIAKDDVELADAIENIDIGGPSMLRSAAKNYRSVGVVVNPDRYSELLEEMTRSKGKLSSYTREQLACEAFAHTARYDAIIAGYLANALSGDSQEKFPDALAPVLRKQSELRYGENPHQGAAFYRVSGGGNVGFVQHHGKALSYNNLIDLEAAWQIVKVFDMPGASVIKHTNPCGAAIADSLSEAYKKAYDADPVSAFGSIVGLNRVVDLATAEQISQTFVEAVIAPAFDDDALVLLQKKPSIRLIEIEDFFQPLGVFQYRHVLGGFLVQNPDAKVVRKPDIDYATKSKPSSKELNDLLFGFDVITHVKSNAILIAKDGQVVGVGAGQMSRVEAVEIALRKAGDKAEGAVLVSDAFFPFRDSVDLAAKAGIKAIIQPGGSKRDQESVDACDDSSISMVFTGVRHFKH